MNGIRYAAILAVLFEAPMPVVAAEFHVAPGGNDASPGTPALPFATLAKARDAARNVDRLKEPVTVWLQDGRYFLSQTLEFGAQDGGGPATPVVYRAVNRQKAVLTGSLVIPAGAFSSVAGTPVEARLRPEARGKVVRIDLKARGIRNIGRFPDLFEAGDENLIQLFAGETRLPLSRYPNEGSMTMARVIQKIPGVFEYRDARHAAWEIAAREGLWLLGFWRVPWQHYAARVTSLTVSNKQVRLAGEMPGGGIGDKYSGAAGSGKEPYIAINLPEEIDRPGEWYLDFAAGMLYLWMPEGASEIRVAENSQPLVSLQGVSNLVLRDLVIATHLGPGVVISGGRDNLLAGCRFTDIMEDAVRVSGGIHHGVRSCDIGRIGGGGVLLSGGNRLALDSARHFVVNNHIQDFGLIKTTYAAAVEISAPSSNNSAQRNDAVGMYVANNRIQNAPHVGIFYGGNNHLFELNEIFDIVKVSDDMGAFYSWGDWTSRGNVIRHNYIHDSPNANAFYVDDGDSGDRFAGNVVRNTRAGAFIGGGHDNIVQANLFLSVATAVHIDNRGVERGYDLGNSRMVNLVRSANHRVAPWSVQYPEMVPILDAGYPQNLPSGNRIDCNLSVNGTRLMDFTAQQAATWRVTLGTNRAVAKTDLAGSAVNLQTVKASGVEKELPCFQPIPMEKIGLFLDEYRTALPPGGGTSRLGEAFRRSAPSPRLSAFRSPDGFLAIRLEGFAGRIELTLCDLRGRALSSRVLVSPGSVEHRFDVPGNPPGVFIVRAAGEGLRVSMKAAR